jgi:hypothetical protein
VSVADRLKQIHQSMDTVNLFRPITKFSAEIDSPDSVSEVAFTQVHPLRHLNTCPVHRRSGGLAYGATYSGPIGVILDPTFDEFKYSELPFHSTLCGSCSDYAPHFLLYNSPSIHGDVLQPHSAGRREFVPA